MIYILILFLLSFNVSLFSQQSTADSLSERIKHATGKEKVDLLGELSDIYQYIDSKSSTRYALEGVELAKKINYKEGLASCYGSLGYSYINLDNEKALYFTKKALEIREKINDNEGIATSLNVLGVIYYYKGNYLESIDYHIKALRLREEIGDDNKTATSYNNIALVYLALEDYETALEYLDKALQIRIKENNLRGIGVIKDNIGTIYRRLKKYEEAFDYLFDALAVNEKLGNIKSLASNHFGIAKNYEALNVFDKALEHYNTALELYKGLNEKHGITISENGIASVYKKQNQIPLAIEHAHIALEYAESVSSLENIVTAADILHSGYYEMGDYENGYKYLLLLKSASDSLKITDKIKRLARLEFENKVKKLEEEQISKINLRNNLITILSISLFFVIVIGGLLIKGYGNKKRMNVKLNELNNKLNETNTAKDRFFSIIAHDLRGPFHGMLSYSDFLASDIDNLSKEEIREYSKELHSIIKNQYELLNDLLNWSKFQSGKFIMHLQKIPLRKEVCSVFESMLFAAEQKGISFINEVEEDFIVYADKNMLLLIIRNLVSNGIKFTGQNGYIKISAIKKSGFDEITVEDNGTGISLDDQKKLFKIDTHHSSKGTAGETGTGIGLILCKEIAEIHSGTITIDSKPGKGSRFSFTLKSFQKN